MPSSSPPLLAACLIVRDEAARLPGCLDSLRPAVERVLVYDTGSVDATVSLARAAGALVVEGSWSGSFAAARNAALQATRDEIDPVWVLSIDADEQLRVSPEASPLLADDGTDAYEVSIENLRPDGSYTHPAIRLFRADRCRWAGAVHEQVVAREGRLPLVVRAAPPAAFGLVHAGYATTELERAKALRNTALARVALTREGDSPQLRYDLARSLFGAGETQEALDGFLGVRDMTGRGTGLWRSATDFVARILLTAGEYELAAGVAEDLRQGGGDAAYCDWLSAQALVHLGRTSEAWPLLAPLQQLRDPDGREVPQGVVRETKSLAASLAGEAATAADLIAATIAHDGRVGSRLPVAQELWQRAGRSPDTLVPAVLEQASPELREALARDLAAAAAE